MRALAILLLFTAVTVSAYKIAIFAPFSANSQFLWNKRVAEVLANHGHSVTLYNLAMFEHDYAKIKLDNRIQHEIVNCSRGTTVAQLIESMIEVTFEDFPLWDKRQAGRFAFFNEVTNSCERLIANNTFIEHVKAGKYDIAFTHTYSFCPVGIIHLTGIPSWVYLNSAAMAEHVASSIGMPAPPSYCSPMMMDAGENMTFVERMKSFIGHIITPLIAKKKTAAVETAFFRKRFGKDFPDLLDISSRVSAVFVNSNEIYDFARPTLHKVVNIGGLGITASDAKPLKGEFAKLVNASAEGHIVFSLGSFAPAYRMPLPWKIAFLESFAAYPNILFFMRYEKPDFRHDSLSIPANVRLFEWLPQTDLLQHPKCRGLITHAGYNSLQDAIHSGVPVVTIPLFGDQHRNAHLAVKLGLGVYLQKDEVKPENVKAAIKSIIGDESKRNHAERLKAMVAKKPVSSEDLLVRWTEFVAEFRQLDNLVPFGVHLSTLVYHSVDVIAFLASVALLILLILYFITTRSTRFLFSLCFGTKKQKKE